MIDKVNIYSYDETYVQIGASEKHILMELCDFFTFEKPGAKFSPAYKAKQWDGKTRLFRTMDGRLYKGLVPYVKQFCAERNYDLEIENGVFSEVNSSGISREKLESFVDSLGLTLKPRDYQIDAVYKAINDFNNRITLISPTSSGKSLIAYILIRYYLTFIDKKILFVVPFLSLVEQLMKDFIQYCPQFQVENMLHLIYEGQSKNSNKKIFCSTWQSIYKQTPAWYNQFDVIIGDEAHTYKEDAVKGVFEKARNTPIKIGLTGTLHSEQNAKCHRLVIEGLIGKSYTVTTTKELMANNSVSQLSINCIVFNYSDLIKEQNKKFDYHQEINFICNYNPRNIKITNIARNIKNENVLIITGFVDHTKTLAELCKLSTDKHVFVITGETDVVERESVRTFAENNNDVIIIATFGVYSTGINIKNLQHVIFATPTKADIRIRQTLGRVLRLDGKSNKATAYDIVDDFKYKNKKNILLRQFFERIKIYVQDSLTYKVIKINI